MESHFSFTCLSCKCSVCIVAGSTSARWSWTQDSERSLKHKRSENVCLITKTWRAALNLNQPSWSHYPAAFLHIGIIHSSQQNVCSHYKSIIRDSEQRRTRYVKKIKIKNHNALWQFWLNAAQGHIQACVGRLLDWDTGKTRSGFWVKRAVWMFVVHLIKLVNMLAREAWQHAVGL